MKTHSILSFKPIRTMPKRLFYKSSQAYRVLDDLNGTKTYAYVYNMVDLETNELVGTMKAGPVLYQNKRYQVYPMDVPYKSYYIAYIESVDSGCGYGSDMIKLAEAESKNTGCEGRVHLTASRIFSPRRPPHLFYRKQGFQSISPYFNEVMDFYISIGKQLSPEYSGNIEMYLPVGIKAKHYKSQSKVSKLVKFFKEKFTKK